MNFKLVRLALLIALGAFQIRSDDIQDAINLVVQASNKILENPSLGHELQPKAFDVGLLAQESCESSACMISEENDSGLFVFMSTSIPEGIWKEYSYALERLGGKFVLKGLPGNDFTALVRFMNELRQKHILAPVEIDPYLFDQYLVKSVPSIVLDDGTQYDKVDGTVSINGALTLFSEKGSTHHRASKLKFKYQQAEASEVLYAN